MTAASRSASMAWPLARVRAISVAATHTTDVTQPSPPHSPTNHGRIAEGPGASEPRRMLRSP